MLKTGTLDTVNAYSILTIYVECTLARLLMGAMERMDDLGYRGQAGEQKPNEPTNGVGRLCLQI